MAVALAMFVLPGLILNVTIPQADPGKMPGAGLWIIVGLIALLVSLIGQLAVIRLAMEPHFSVGEAIVHGTRRLPVYVAAILIWLVPILIIGSVLYDTLGANEAHPPVAASLALLAISLIGIFLAVRLMLSSAVTSAEPIGPIRVLHRSWILSEGNWWRLFVFLVLFGVAAVCLLVAVESVVGLLVRTMLDDSGPFTVGNLITAIVTQLVSSVLSVVFFVMLARIYVQRSGVGTTLTSVPNSGN